MHLYRGSSEIVAFHSIAYVIRRPKIAAYVIGSLEIIAYDIESLEIVERHKRAFSGRCVPLRTLSGDQRTLRMTSL